MYASCNSNFLLGDINIKRIGSYKLAIVSLYLKSELQDKNFVLYLTILTFSDLRDINTQLRVIKSRIALSCGWCANVD